MSINRNSFLSLIESINASTSEKVVKEGPDWETHKPSVKQKFKRNNPAKSTVGDASGVGNSPAPSSPSQPEAIAETDSLWLSRRDRVNGKSTSRSAKTRSKASGAQASTPSAQSTASSPSAPNMAMSENFDKIDWILAEGIEIYGEENMTKILSHFERTGKISKELYDLINSSGE